MVDDRRPTGCETPHVRTPIPGPRSLELTARLARRECPAFEARRETRSRASGDDLSPIVLARGLGSNVWDVDDNRYVDLAAGFGSVLLGHGAPELLRAAAAQSNDLVQGLGDLYPSEPKILLIERLARLHPDPDARVILCQSGADAVTAALKTAALATGKHGLVAFDGGYHGLGYAPLAACGFRPSFREPFAPELNPDVHFAPYPRSESDCAASLDAVDRALTSGEIAAVLLEPIQGRGGVVVPPPGFLRDLASAAHRKGALVIADEIWTGLGRAGAMVRSIVGGVTPDIVCFGKGLGGGFSISACVGSDEAMRGWARGGEVIHTSTHAGAPLPCASALKVLDRIEDARLDTRAAASGERLKSALRDVAKRHSIVTDVRGEGLMVGIEHASGALGLRAMKGLLERGIISTVGGTGGEVVVLTPSLVIDESLFEACAEAFDATWSALDAR